jgi:rhamnogalacturonyl hydrolase YesR
MDGSVRINKVKMAMLAIQRYSWEQGIAAQALQELGEKELVIQLASEAVLRQLADGRLGVVGNSTAVTDPGSNGEAVLYAFKVTGDARYGTALDKMTDWLLNKAPRTTDGTLYHFNDRPQVWVDSFSMAPPYLAATGHYKEALKQIEGFRKLLYNPEKKLFSHMWDDDLKGFVRKDFWGVGNGWALAGMARVIAFLPDSMEQEKKKLAGYIHEALDGCLAYIREDGLFHDVLDNPSAFVETNTAQMLAYTIFRGIRAGWLDTSYLKYAEKMREAACGKVDEYGFVQGVCGSPYFDRPGTAAEGQAFFLFMEAAARDFYSEN